MDFWAVIKAHISFYGSFRKTRKKRRMLKHGPLRNVMRSNVVIEYFLKGKRRFSDLDFSKFYRGDLP